MRSPVGCTCSYTGSPAGTILRIALRDACFASFGRDASILTLSRAQGGAVCRWIAYCANAAAGLASKLEGTSFAACAQGDGALVTTRRQQNLRRLLMVSSEGTRCIWAAISHPPKLSHL